MTLRRLTAALALCAAPMLASESRTSNVGVSTSSRYSTQAAVNVLRDGGSAIDAAVAAAFVLTVARPHAVGLGGGGFLLYYDAGEAATWAVDFREAAPWKYEVPDEDSPPLEGITAAATPGLVRGLTEAHERFGTAPWKSLLAPAIALASEGIDVDDELAGAINMAREKHLFDDTASSVILHDAKGGLSPTRIQQPALADSLERLARSGGDDFYEGSLAARIVEFLTASGATLSRRDLKEYHPVWRAPLQITLGDYTIQTAPPPARGGVAIASMLAILEGYDLKDVDLTEPVAAHIIAEAERRAIVDSRRVVGDPAYARIGLAEILSAERSTYLRSTIDPRRASATPSVMKSPSEHTAHISIIDAAGNIASMTLSLGGPFGSGVMIPETGIFLNSALKDFGDPRKVEANSPEPRKRPSSPLAPMIILESGKPKIAIGAAGGDAIASCLATVVLRVTRKGESISEAIAAPRIHQSDFPDRALCEMKLADTASALEAMGHNVETRESIGEVIAVFIDGEELISVSDSRGKGSTGGF